MNQANINWLNLLNCSSNSSINSFLVCLSNNLPNCSNYCQVLSGGITLPTNQTIGPNTKPPGPSGPQTRPPGPQTRPSDQFSKIDPRIAFVLSQSYPNWNQSTVAVIASNQSVN
jgi:hypothetical protein